MSLESLPVIAKWAAAALGLLSLYWLPTLLARWRAVHRIYGRMPWSLARQMLWYTRKSAMAFPVIGTFACLPFTIAGGVRQLFFDDPPGYFLLGLAAQVYMLVRVADVVLPPAVLLLGASLRDTTAALAGLNTWLRDYRTIGLLHPREWQQYVGGESFTDWYIRAGGPSFYMQRAFYFNNIRTRNGYEWRSIVFHLMDVVPVIVIAGDTANPAVAEELERIQRRGYQGRTAFLDDAAGGVQEEGIGRGILRLNRDSLADWLVARLARPDDCEKRWERQVVISQMLAEVPLRVRDPQTVFDLVAKARYIEDYEIRRFVCRLLGREPDWWETPLLEDIPPREVRAKEVGSLRTSRGLEEVGILLAGALEWVDQNPGPGAPFNAASAYNKLGRLARLRGEWDEAIRLIEEAIKRFELLTGDSDPTSALAELSVAHFNLGEVYMARFREGGKADDRSSAVERYRRSITIDQETGEDSRLVEYRLRSL